MINYIHHYIKTVNPKVIITFIDNSIFFYKLKKDFPNIKFIAVQNGNRRRVGDIYDNLSKNKNKLMADYIFTFGKVTGESYSKHIKFKNYSLGSFRNNSVSIQTRKTKDKKKILFISQFRKENINWPSFFHTEEKLLPLISNFCEKYNLKLYILGVHKNSEIEKNYFCRILKKDQLNFINKKYYPQNYKTLDNFNLVVFIDSTLGYEAIARKKKVAAFSSRKFSSNGPKLSFGWPKKIKKRGFFYTDKITEKEVNRILNNVNNCDEHYWKKKTSKILNEIIIYNKDNKVLKKVLNNNLK
jgi:surface carbohydrate biosynthesis protein